MADVFSKKKRSQIMSLIRGKNTGIEKKVFSFLVKNKMPFKRHYSKAAGSPDVALPEKKIAIFIDGDFWHGYRFSEWKGRIPKKYWRKKIESNIARDKKNRNALRNRKWRVMRVWGHQIAKDPEKAFSKILNFINKTSI